MTYMAMKYKNIDHIYVYFRFYDPETTVFFIFLNHENKIQTIRS